MGKAEGEWEPHFERSASWMKIKQWKFFRPKKAMEVLVYILLAPPIRREITNAKIPSNDNVL